MSPNTWAGQLQLSRALEAEKGTLRRAGDRNYQRLNILPETNKVKAGNLSETHLTGFSLLPACILELFSCLFPSELKFTCTTEFFSPSLPSSILAWTLEPLLQCPSPVLQ